MAFTIWERAAAAAQSRRVRPTGAVPAEGNYVFVLGHDSPNRFEYVNDGNKQRVEQNANVDADLISLSGFVRGPASMPVGGTWTFRGDIAGRVITFEVEPERERDLGDLVFAVGDLGGAETFFFELEYNGPDFEEVELPAVYLDDIQSQSSLGAGLLLAGRTPEPGQTDVSVNTPIVVQVVGTLASPPAIGGEAPDEANTDIYVDGELAFTGGSAQPGWDGAGSGITLNTGLVREFTLVKTTPFDSTEQGGDVVDVRVVSQSTDTAQTIDETYSFTLEDLAVPQVDDAFGIALNQVQVNFDEAVNLEQALDPDNYLLEFQQPDDCTPGVSVVVESVEIGIDENSFILTTDINLTHGVPYLLTIANIEDDDGNLIGAPFNTFTFLGYTPPQPAGRELTIYNWFPQMNRNEDSPRFDLKKLSNVWQEVVDQCLFSVDEWTNILDFDKAEEQFVDAILCHLGNPFNFPLSLIDKRRLAAVLVEIYRQKGTSKGIKNVARFFLGFEIEILPFEGSGTWVLGESELGVDTVLGITDPKAPYSFIVEVPIALTDTQRRRLLQIIEYMKPAHTHLVELIEPEAPEVFDHWVIGISSLGENTLLH